MRTQRRDMHASEGLKARSLKTFAVSISSLGVASMPSCTFVHEIGSTIRNAMNIGAMLADI